MTRTVTSVRAWALVAAMGVVALTGASAANATATSSTGDTSAVTKGDLTETLSWTGELAYANAASLTYKSGQSDSGGPSVTTGGLAAASTASKLTAFTVALTATASATPEATATATASATPEATATATASATPEAAPGPEPSGTPTPGGTTTCCPCVDPSSAAPAVSFGGSASSSGSAPSGAASSGATSSTDTASALAGVGLVTWLPAAGSVVSNGEALYRVDNTPVVLLEGAATLYRDLATGATGDDVEALETALAALGYGTDLTVDQTFTSVTAAALNDFQEAVGIDATGTLDLTTVVMHDGPVVVSTLVAAVGDEASSGTEMLVMSDPVRDVALSLDPSQLTSIAVGDTVSVKLLDGSAADATVASIAAAPSTDGTFALIARLDPSVEVAGDHYTVTVSYARTLATDALLIDPYAIVLLEGNHTVVRVLRGDEVVDVEVAVIATAGRSTAVSSADLNEGDTIES